MVSFFQTIKSVFVKPKEPTPGRTFEFKDVPPTTSKGEGGETISPGGGGGGISEGIPTKDIAKIISTKSIENLETTLISAGVPTAEAKALTIREQIKQEAAISGKGLTRLQFQRRLGGGLGVSSLRGGTRRLRKSDLTIRDFLPRIKERIKTPLSISEGISDKKIISFETKKDIIPSFGVPIITLSERESGVVGFVPQVEEGELAPGFSLIQTSPQTFISNVFGRTKEDIVFTQRNILEAESQQKELVSIEKEFKEDPTKFIGLKGVEQKGQDIILTEEFFEDKFKPTKESTIEARKFFGDLPSGKRRQADISSILTGATSFGVGITEFGGTLITSLGQQQLKETEFKPFSLGKQFRFGGELGKFREQPGLPTTTGFIEDPFQFVKEKAVSPQLVTELSGTGALIFVGGGGILKNIKASGFKEGILESAAIVTPIRPKPGLFGIKPLPETPIESLSFKFKQDGITKKLITGVGKEDPFSLTSIQFSKKDIGFGETIIQTKGTLIKPSGTIIEGRITSGTESFFSGKVGEKISLGKDGLSTELPKFKGGVSDTFTQQRFSLFEGQDILLLDIVKPSTKFKVGKGAGASIETGEVTTRFGFGKRQPVLKSEVFETKIDLLTGKKTPTDFIIQPTGRFRFKPSITGREINLNKLIELDSKAGDIIGIRGSGKKTPFSKTFQQQELSSQLSGIQVSVKEFKIPEIKSISRKIIVSKQPSQVSELVGIPRSVGGEGLTDFQLRTKERDVFDIRQTNFNVLGISSSEISQERLRGIQEVSQSLLPRERLREFQATTPIQQTKQIQKQIKTQRDFFIDPFIKDFGFGGFKPSGGFGVPFLLPSLPKFGVFGEKKKPKKREKSKTRIAPSFTGIVLGIEEAPIISESLGVLPGQIRGLETGFDVPKKKKKTKKK